MGNTTFFANATRRSRDSATRGQGGGSPPCTSGRKQAKNMSRRGEFIPPLGTLCAVALPYSLDFLTTPHSVPRGGINSPRRDTFLACFRQEVQGGEPPPCPRVALSRDRRVAFAKNVVFPIVALATGIFGDFYTFFRLTRPELGIFPLSAILGALFKMSENTLINSWPAHFCIYTQLGLPPLILVRRSLYYYV